MRIVVCVEQVLARDSLEVDPYSGQLTDDRAVHVTEPGVQAALEVALSLKESASAEVALVAVGPREVERSLRECMAFGVDESVRIWGNDWPSDPAPALIASALARHVREEPSDLVLCGDGGDQWRAVEVPAWLAEHLDLPLVSAVTEMEVDESGDRVTAHRKLEKGYRQVVEASTPAVLAIDPGSRVLRDASLPGIISAQTGPIRMLDMSYSMLLRMAPHTQVIVGPVGQPQRLRPQPQPLFCPDHRLSACDRVEQLITGGLQRKRGEVVTGDPRSAAERIVAFLSEHGLVKASASSSGKPS